MSYYQPEPTRRPTQLPLQSPVRKVPSYLGEGVGNWLFYSGAGDVLHDFSGNSNHGSINGPKWTDEQLASWGLEFDGVDDNVDFGVNSELRNQEFTVAGWFYWNELPDNYDYLVALGYADSTSQGVKLAADSTVNEYEVELYDSGGTRHGFTAGDISTGQWDFMVFTYDGSTEVLYRNGSQIGSNSVSVTVAYDDTVSDVLGYAPDRNARYFPGIQSGVRIYDRARPEDEIKSMHEKTKPLYVG